MEDVEYMQNKIFAAIRTPKTYLNFQEAQGKGQNLSIMDIRFSRMINRVQQFLLMELNKIAMIRLINMGLEDEIGDLTKKLTAMQTALADPGTGIPMMSMHKALKDIMKMSDSEIKDMLNEIRLEKAMSAELENTSNIIKKTGIFDSVDNIYGDYEAMNNPQAQLNSNTEEDGEFGGLGGGPVGGFDGDMDMDLGEPGTSEEGDLGGDMGESDMSNASDIDNGQPLMENILKHKSNIDKQNKNKMIKSFTQRYFEMLSEGFKDETMLKTEPKIFESKIATINNNINELCEQIDELVNEDELEKEKLITDAMKIIKEKE